MKKIIKSIIPAMAIFFATMSYSQNQNWGNLTPEIKHHVNLHLGWNYGLTFGLGYGYQFNFALPTVLNIDFSAPAGEDLFDDFKIKIGGQIKLYEIKNFCFAVNAHGVFRRYENDLVRMLNFGSDFSGVIGYYKPNWFIAGEAGFDKAIVTHFKHSQSYRDNNYEDVKDGWYEPATGGNFYYGVQTGFSVRKSEFTLAIGRVLTQDFKTMPTIPYYAQLGYNVKL